MMLGLAIRYKKKCWDMFTVPVAQLTDSHGKPVKYVYGQRGEVERQERQAGPVY